MKITSEVIQQNLLTLEKATKSFQVLKEYFEKSSLKTEMWNKGKIDNYYWDNESKLRLIREEARTYKLNIYLDFIDYIEECKRNHQDIFYRKKIKNTEFRNVLILNSIDEEAKNCFKNKTKATFSKFINSKKWELLSNEYRTNRVRSRGKRYNDNLAKSSAIIANFCIQNEIELEAENFKRIKHWYIKPLPEPDYSILNEIQRTSSIIDFILTKLSENNSDFRKVNIEHLSLTIKNELSKKLLSLQKLEKIRCLEVAKELSEELTINKIYEVRDLTIESGVLKVEVINDKNNTKFYFYRNFETVSNLRENFISDILDEF